MNQFNDLIDLWKNQPAPENADFQKRLDRALQDARTLARKVWMRDLLEIGTGLTTSAIFLVMGILFGGKVLLGATVAATCLLLVTLILVLSRVQQARENRLPRPTLKAELELKLKAVQRQYRLLSNVTLWYLAPIALAIAAFIGGVEAESPSPDYTFLLFYAVSIGILFLFVRYWNHTYARNKLDPQVRELERLLKDMETQA